MAGGTYFGATGCGKTYTMAFLARQLALRCTDISEIGSPTIILIVDRDELQKQGAKLFTKSTEFLNLGEVSVVKNRTQLRQELGARQSGGFYICTIQKFCDREDDKIGLINDRQNIICFSDEAHRTQLEHSKKIQFSKDADANMKAMVSKPYAKVLKEAFPQATFVGFTGTPIAETYQTFGDEIDRYTMDQAVADGLTVSIKYHPRIAKVLLDKNKVKEIEDYYKKCADDGATFEDVEASKKAMSSMEIILGEPSRLERLASLSAHDKMFLRRITDKKGSDYEYSLKDVEKVLSSPVLRVVDFYEEETLNFNLLKGLLVNQENPKYQKYLSALIKQMKDNKDTEFISKFYDSTQFDKTFIIKLNEQWTDFFSYIAVNKILPLKQIRGFSLDSLCLLDENKIQDIKVEGCLTDYITNQRDNLNIQNPDVAKIISQFCILGVKLKKIEIDTANKDLIVGVYENNLYELTFENIKLMIKSMYGEYDSYNIEHRNYTVIQGKSESPLAKYIAENINRYANEYLKNCNGYIEDSEDVAIKFINDENVLGDIQEKYVNVLKTVISDISVIQNKKLWNEMLDKRIIKKTVPNIIHYYTEYCCDSQLIKFINECDAGMDYSHIENEFGGEIARQFFDSVAVNNEISRNFVQYGIWL